ncbi:pantoate--beta-alanine ligase [Paenibacillus sp. JX-17]|uniref:Pantothenate synthetase n=1 Tax=Paenibacillus lacisoli TaxID=3064525 RepID=A0ABT9C8W0_9BACL|nr:pantoate--beta-alanine ligase [Paenibacillus sp. JX-17]MDO7905033.1 pantoate--beta-alanine ligase [Paenibacillus sp. JX-17]
MIVIRDTATLREEIKQRRRAALGADVQVGLVPTMGYLHDGHASLMRAARKQSDVVVLSIFVNPIQFGPNEDFDSYPRDEERDLALAEREGVDIVFIPTVEVMYPGPTKTKIQVSGLTSRLCGASRPGHFDGVTTVVAKLFNLVQPDLAFFGMKDAQQVAVLQQMVQDLNMPVHIVPCPIVREEDGLALSSRNVYLSEEEREQALVLSRALREAESAVTSGTVKQVTDLRRQLEQTIGTSSLALIDYVEILTFPGLEPLDENMLLNTIDQDLIIALAVKFGRTRLIDNIRLQKAEVHAYV